MQITIVRRPIGEAPDWVKDAWIGLSLPVAIPEQRTLSTVGVLSRPKTRLHFWWAALRGRTEKVTGFIVDARRAITLLSAVRPDAADWWVENAPYFAAGEEMFIFDAACCEVTATRGPWER